MELESFNVTIYTDWTESLEKALLVRVLEDFDAEDEARWLVRLN